MRRTGFSLDQLCTASNLNSALPSNGTLLGTNAIPSSTSVEVVYDSSTNGGIDDKNHPYCFVNVTHSHPGKSNQVRVRFAFPQPSDFHNRFYVTGGGGYSLSSSVTGGLQYGAVSGASNAGYDGFNQAYDDVVLLGNNSTDWNAMHMFGYQALGELTVPGKHLTRRFYGMSDGDALFAYFEGCSDGGREGMSQVRRWGDEYDGVIVGPPAFRYAQQQVNHVFSSVVESTLGYFPPPCAIEKIVNATIAARDPLDGRTDIVVARTDLCQLKSNLSSVVGQPYYCAAITSTSLGFGSDGNSTVAKRETGAGPGSTTSYQPEQNRTVTASDVAVAQNILEGLHNSQGQRAYISWQVSSSFGDTGTTWNNDTNAWELSIPSTGGEFVTKFVQLVNATNLSDLDGVTYDTLVEWMQFAYDRCLDTLQTTFPDLSIFQSHGGKLLHYHGEADGSVPAASSVHYWQSAKRIMYPNITNVDMSDWYQLCMVPGAGHCGIKSLQPGPYPQNNMQTTIRWIENGVRSSGLNATISSGDYAGETQMLCQWPQRSLWTSEDIDFDCVTDQQSLNTWSYEFPAFKTPIY